MQEDKKSQKNKSPEENCAILHVDSDFTENFSIFSQT